MLSLSGTICTKVVRIAILDQSAVSRGSTRTNQQELELPIWHTEAQAKQTVPHQSNDSPHTSHTEPENRQGSRCPPYLVLLTRHGLSASTQALFTWRCASKASSKSYIKHKKFGVKPELPPAALFVTSHPHIPLIPTIQSVYLERGRPQFGPRSVYWPGSKTAEMRNLFLFFQVTSVYH